MSSTGVGPALAVNGPLPVAPEYGLLSVANVQRGAGPWLNGVNVWAYPGGDSENPSGVAFWEPCTSGTFRTKDEGGDQVSARFDSIVAYVSVTCSTLVGDPEAFAARARAALNARESFAAETILAKGQADSANKFLGDDDLVVLGTGAQDPSEGLSYLENAIGATGIGGVIHATPGIAAQWGFNKQETNSVVFTSQGTPVAIGGGYIDTDPVGETAADPSAGQEWAFATGPVEVRVAEMRLDAIESIDRTINEITYRAEVALLVFWDTLLQAGVLIDWVS